MSAKCQHFLLLWYFLLEYIIIIFVFSKAYCPDGCLDTQFWSSFVKDVLPILLGTLDRDLAWASEPAGSHSMDLFWELKFWVKWKRICRKIIYNNCMEHFPMRHVLIYSFVLEIIVKVWTEASAWLRLL